MTALVLSLLPKNHYVTDYVILSKEMGELLGDLLLSLFTVNMTLPPGYSPATFFFEPCKNPPIGF